MENDDTVPGGDDEELDLDEDLGEGDGDSDDDDLSPAAEPGPAVEAERLAQPPAAPVQPVAVAEAVTDVPAEPVQAAGIVDTLLGNAQILLPFILNPAKIGGVVEGIELAVNGETLTARWQGVKKVGDLTVPIVEQFVDRAKLAVSPSIKSADPKFADQAREVVSICQMRTMAEATAHVEAKRLGDGQLLKRLRDGLGKFAESEVGSALLGMLLKQLMGGLVPLGGISR